jgi:regulator of sigma E protease
MSALVTGSNFLLIVLGFSVLITVHELGHWLAAKWAGIRTEGFAVGMGPVVVSWRKGFGFRLGSGDAEFRRRFGKAAIEMDRAELTRLGLGETEFSLRALPLGGFVRMLGQDDADPSATSDRGGSYQRCPVGKRMVVVSAGVVMNLALAALLFLFAFLVGVRFEAPVAGGAVPGSPAARAVAAGAEGVEPGIRPGDRIERAAGSDAWTFSDVMIAAAMAKPGVPVEFAVRREGVAEPLRFSIMPERDPASGLLSVGIVPSTSATLTGEPESASIVAEWLSRLGLDEAGVRPGMTVASAGGTPIATYEQLSAAARAGGGAGIATTWTAPDGTTVAATVPVEPTFARLAYPPADGRPGDYEDGLLGLVPLVAFGSVLETSPNREILREGDIVLEVAGQPGPRRAELLAAIKSRAGATVPLVLERDGERLSLDAVVDRDGRIGVGIVSEVGTARIARPMEAVADGEGGSRPTPLAGLGLFPLSTVTAVDDEPVADWNELRRAVAAARAAGATSLELEFAEPLGGTRERHAIDLATAGTLADLAFVPALPGWLFDPDYVTLSAGGDPLRAISMGFAQTRKLVLLTYLTLDRVFRGSVGVDQLHGPVGIVHLGTKVADRGFMYLVFFLAMISVNLAVLNFLPLPIVDGGLFLYLVYEKVTGRPPSIAFQNAAGVAGLALLGTLFLVTFYNDLARLAGG